MATPRPVRRLVLFCPDWPVVAAIAAAGAPVQSVAAVFKANRVVACSATARARGVTRGMRRRDAQARCPELLVLQRNEDQEGRVFETVAGAVERHAPGIQIVRPGLVAVPISGAAVYAGGEAALAEQLIDDVSAAAGVEALAGVADGLFAAILAARRGRLVDPGRSRDFLAPLPLTELDEPGSGRADLVGLLHRFGLRTIGDFAQLPERDITARFGRAGTLAHRLARGLDEHPPTRRAPPPDLAVEEVFGDEPIDRIDSAAFAAKRLADRLHARLAAQGLAVTQLAISATTSTGQHYVRVWRAAVPLTAAAIGDRVRWQLEGWLTRPADDRPAAGIELLRLAPEETVGGGSLQMQLPAAGQSPDADERAARALRRIQAILGPDSVLTAIDTGGRGPRERMTLVPFEDRHEPAAERAPWPGTLPTPAPATTPPTPWPAQVHDAHGDPLGYTGRGRLTALPDTVVVADRPPRSVLSWAGPWPASTPGSGLARRGVRIQVVLAETTPGAGETALLLLGHDTDTTAVRWEVEGLYD